MSVVCIGYLQFSAFSFFIFVSYFYKFIVRVIFYMFTKSPLKNVMFPKTDQHIFIFAKYASHVLFLYSYLYTADIMWLPFLGNIHLSCMCITSKLPNLTFGILHINFIVRPIQFISLFQLFYASSSFFFCAIVSFRNDVQNFVCNVELHSFQIKLLLKVKFLRKVRLFNLFNSIRML